MHFSVLPQSSQVFSFRRQFEDNETAVAREEAELAAEIEKLVNPAHLQSTISLGIKKREEEDDEEEEDEIEMQEGSEREFDDYADELETSDVEP